MKYIDVKKASEQWNISQRRITTLCRNGRIDGAKKERGMWMIPYNANKPQDGRKRDICIESTNRKLLLPIGISDFKKLVTDYYYIDKTLFIKDFLDNRPQVSLFTRPRRFGKTLTMSMLKTFFEKTDEDNSVYFYNTKIWSCGEEYRKYQGIYPVIFLTFKDVKYNTWNETRESIYYLLQEEFDRHSVVLDSKHVSDLDKQYYKNFINGNMSDVELVNALSRLSKMLCRHYKQSVIIIIDEYDTPIQKGYMEGFYNDVVMFMRNLFSGAFKDNSDLAFGFLTGILRVAKESIFSGMNNLKINSLIEQRYSEYFGFTNKEILDILKYYGCEEKYNEVCEWYNGYNFGNVDIFNPWSVLNYLDEGCKAKAFWQSTGDNTIIQQIVAEANNDIIGNMKNLLQGKSLYTYIDTSVIYPEIKNNPATIYSFLLAAGYLKIIKNNKENANNVYRVAIPNKEILYVYEKEIIASIFNKISQSSAIIIKEAIMNENIDELQRGLDDFLITTISSFDYSNENFYQGLMLGLCAIMNNMYKVNFNRESSYGRYDIQLRPYNNNMPGIIMELKVVRNSMKEDNISEELVKLANEALQQIETKNYIADMCKDGVNKFIKIGIAFYKKYVKMVNKYE